MCPARWGRWPWYPGKGAGHVPAGFLLCGVGDSWPWGSPGDWEGGSGTWDSFWDPPAPGIRMLAKMSTLGEPKAFPPPQKCGQEFNMQLWLPCWDGRIHRGGLNGAKMRLSRAAGRCSRHRELDTELSGPWGSPRAGP